MNGLVMAVKPEFRSGYGLVRAQNHVPLDFSDLYFCILQKKDPLQFMAVTVGKHKKTPVKTGAEQIHRAEGLQFLLNVVGDAGNDATFSHTL